MGMVAKDVKEWLNTVPDDHLIAIDDGGMLLVDVDEKEDDVYLEIGGIPDEEEEPEMHCPCGNLDCTVCRGNPDWRPGA